jgi:hypothetical protein
MRRADNLTTFMCRLSWNLGTSTCWNCQGLSRPVMELLYLIIIIYLSWNWTTCWPVPVSRIQKSLQRSAMIPSASWRIVFRLKKIGPASFRESCQCLKFSLNGLRSQSRVSPVVGLLPLASGQACLGMAFSQFLVKQLHRCDLVVISSFVRTGCTTLRWGWPLGSIGYSTKRHYPLYLCFTFTFTFTPYFQQVRSWRNIQFQTNESSTKIDHFLRIASWAHDSGNYVYI